MARLPRDVRFTFTGGEISPLLIGRSDLEKYFTSLETCENFIITPYGPAERRSGTRFVAEVKDSSASSHRLVAFNYTVAQGYILEFGNLYMRVYRSGGQVQSGGIPFEMITPYTTADLNELQFQQNADALYVAHPSYAPRRINRFADDSWTITTMNFLPMPSSEVGLSPGATLTPGATSGAGITFTASAPSFLASDVGREIRNIKADGRAVIITLTDTTHVVANILDAFPNVNPIIANNWVIDLSPNTTLTPSAKGPRFGTITLTLGTSGWRTNDVGRLVHVHGGICKITTYTSDTIVSAQVLKPLTLTSTANGGEWTLEEEVWSPTNGYPRAIGMHENRLLLGGSARFPSFVWGSATDDFNDFGEGTNDDDAFSFNISASFVDTIQWLSPLKRLFVGTFGAEHVVNDGVNDPMSPNNIVVRGESNVGSPHLQPIRTDDSLIFINRHQNKLQELGFSLQDDSFITTNLLLLAEHLAGPCSGSITRIAFQRESRPIIWVIRTDGTLLGITFLKKQNVTAAHRHILGGLLGSTQAVVEEVAVLPHWSQSYDTVWLIVKRTINGLTKRYIEYIDRDLNSDSALTRPFDGILVSSVSGLSHLEGQTVWVIGDNTPQAKRTVLSGAVTVSPAASAVEVGLDYVSTLTIPPIQKQGSQLLGLVKRIIKVVVNFYQTIDAVINNKALTLGTVTAPYTDEVIVENLGYDRDGRITVKQDRPLPMTILDIAAEVAIDEDRR